ncbi:tellurite resistance TerB family protein [Arenibaculum pallidiluteum]|uniref:tellurite resistance TerB family protein n=1 Tax=Arenibaculum pallidiluteum TaxID=2812559 RepID=UPI001A963D45|nr:tellurite resistance TerB family protein [Arenibaculum pallidiluteum]
MIDHQSALLYTMVLVAAADAEMTDPELDKIGELVRYLPAFRGFDLRRIPEVTRACSALLQDEDGLDKALEQIRDGLPRKLHETAYAVACDVAAANVQISQEVLRLLEMIRHRLEIDRLVAAAIERGARARHATA